MIITSFSAEGFQEYGERFIEGFLKRWKDETLTVYVEGQETADAIRKDYPDVHVKDLLLDPEFVQFASLVEQSDPLYQGRMRHPQTGLETYNFRYNAHKFFRKVFAITDYSQSVVKDWTLTHTPISEPFAWLDADVVFNKDLPYHFLKDTLAGHYIAYLGRANLYSETGFIAWDPSFLGHDEFMRDYRKVFLTGAFRLLTEWHDCQVFDFVRLLHEADCRNLAKGCDPNHPFVYSVLGTYMDHLKGPERKAAGQSQELSHVA